MERIGIIGTSWWADAMYLPPLAGYEKCEVVACCGRNQGRADAFAERWRIKHVFTEYQALIDSGLCDAVVIATANDTHYPIAMAAIKAGLHILCEKPLGLNLDEANAMRDAAEAKGITTLVPFTYRFMPATRYLKSLIDDGFIGKPYHMHMRYYAGFGRDGSDYVWRFDVGRAGSGALGDIGSHFLYLADWLYGEIEAVSSSLGKMVDRPKTDPNGNEYEQADDTAMLMLRFKNGAQGMVHATTLAYEDTPFGQVHEMDFHGSGGTLRQKNDWRETQQITGARDGEGFSRELPIPDEHWGDARREVVIETYKDVFRVDGHMVRRFVDAIAEGRAASPDFADGARIQAVLEAAIESSESGQWVTVQ